MTFNDPFGLNLERWTVLRQLTIELDVEWLVEWAGGSLDSDRVQARFQLPYRIKVKRDFKLTIKLRQHHLNCNALAVMDSILKQICKSFRREGTVVSLSYCIECSA